MRSYIWFPLTGTKASLLTFRIDPARTGPVLSVSFGGCSACDASAKATKALKHCPPDSNVSINCRAVTNSVQLTGTTPTLTAKPWLLMDVIRRVKSLSRSFYTTVPPPSATLHSLMYMRWWFSKASQGNVSSLLPMDAANWRKDSEEFRECLRNLLCQ